MMTNFQVKQEITIRFCRVDHLFNFLFVIEQTSPFLTSEMNVAAF